MFIFIVPFSLAALIAVCTIISRSMSATKAAQAAARASTMAAAAAEEKAKAAAEKKVAREKAAAAQHAAKLARANELREISEKRLAAERALKSLQTGSIPPTSSAGSMSSASGHAFSGQVVAFTGSIPGVKRADAIAEIKRQGGRAYNGDMGADVTMIIVGNVRKETDKLRKAKAWGIKQVPASEWLRLCNA